MAEIKKALKKLLPHLLQARQDHLNESDTVSRIAKVFEDVLGWDGMSDISSEVKMKGKYVDLVLKVDGVIRILVEAKAAHEKLKDAHIDQAQGYASKNNYRWVLLTNGVNWNLYHLTFDEGIEYELAFSLDLSNAETLDKSIEMLGLLHKNSIKKDLLEDFWEKATALNPASVGKALCQHEVLMVIRKEVRKQQGILVDPQDLLEAIHGMMSADARERIGPMKVKMAKAKKSVPKPDVAVSGKVEPEAESVEEQSVPVVGAAEDGAKLLPPALEEV